jgi:hypothetical protein
MIARRIGLVLFLGLLATNRVAAYPEPDPMLVEQRDAARKTYETVLANYRDGRSSEELLYRWSKRWLRAEQQLSDRPDDRIAAAAAHLDRMIELERFVQKLQTSGQITIDVVSACAFYRAEAAQWLAQARKAKKEP